MQGNKTDLFAEKTSNSNFKKNVGLKLDEFVDQYLIGTFVIQLTQLEKTAMLG